MTKIIFTIFLSFSIFYIASAQNDALNIDPNGNVGIGISKAENRMDIKDSISRTGVHPKGLGLYVTGKNGVEFRNPDGTKGIGFVENAIYSTSSDKQLNFRNNLHMDGNAIYLRKGTNDANDIIKWLDLEDRVGIGGWAGVTLGYTSDQKGLIKPVMTINSAGMVGIGDSVPKAIFEVSRFINDGKLGIIFGRLNEGNGRNNGDGTYLGVRGFGTQSAYGGKGFSLEHSFYGIVNSAINFYRGGGTMGGYITFSTNNNNEQVVITNTGNVGIGTMTPRARLEVNGTQRYPGQSFTWFNKGGRIGTQGNEQRDLSILTSGDIATGYEFIIYSDARIKKDLVRSNSVKDLAILNGLQVTDYKYRDVIHYGNEYKKGFIAQEVERVFPEAVRKGEDFVPDIFSAPQKMVEKEGTIIITMPGKHHLINGDIIRLFTKNGQEEKVVTVLGENTFSIEGAGDNYKDIFVFGKKVDDFRMLDYDRLFTLNISATQELSKEINMLKAENEEMKKENEKMKNSYDELQGKLMSLEAKVDGMTSSATALK
jgi:hypothetical protein